MSCNKYLEFQLIHLFVLYSLDEGDGFRLKWTIGETSGVARRVRQEQLGGEGGRWEEGGEVGRQEGREGDEGEGRGVSDRDNEESKKKAHNIRSLW